MTARRLGPVLAVALLAVPATILAFQFRDYAVDDFFITYRYAANLAAGEGLVFNPGERVFGTTAAGHALILAAARALTGAAMTRIGTAVTLVAKLALVVLLYLESRRRNRGPEALVGGVLLVSHPFSWLHNGAEVHVVLALLAVSAAVAGRRPGAAGALAGYAGWCRPDAVLGLGLLGLQEWIRRRRIPWRYGLAASGVLAAGLAGAYLWFGSPLPRTLAAKRAQAVAFPGAFPSGADFWAAIAENLANLYGVTLVPLVLLAVVGLPFLLRRAGAALRLLTLYGLGLAIAYPALGVPPYTWYAVPVFTVGVYGACFAAGEAGRGTWRFFGGRPAAALPALAMVGILLGPVVSQSARRTLAAVPGRGTPVRLDLYRRTSAWLQGNTAEDQVVATLEVGGLGFYSERPIHDLLALVSPLALPAVRRGDLTAAFHAGRPDLFVVYSPHRSLLQPILDDPAFQAVFCPVMRLSLGKKAPAVTVYGRLPRPAGTPCLDG